MLNATEHNIKEVIAYVTGKKDIMRHVLEEMNKEGEFKGKIKVRI